MEWDWDYHIKQKSFLFNWSQWYRRRGIKNPYILMNFVMIKAQWKFLKNSQPNVQMPERVYTLECENYVDNDGKRLTDEESTKHLINCEQPADINAKLEH